MKKNINITIDLTKSNEEIWEQINNAYAILKKYDKKPWYKRLLDWFHI